MPCIVKLQRMLSSLLARRPTVAAEFAKWL
jgi:hypothetical protein